MNLTIGPFPFRGLKATVVADYQPSDWSSMTCPPCDEELDITSLYLNDCCDDLIDILDGDLDDLTAAALKALHNDQDNAKESDYHEELNRGYAKDRI